MKRIKKISALILVLFLCASMFSASPVSAANSPSPSKTYSYTRVGFIEGGGDITSKFKLSYNGGMIGLCTEGGPMSKKSGKCKVKVLPHTGESKESKLAHLAYYYGQVKGHTSGANGCHLARAFHYVRWGYAYHQSASTSSKMVNTAMSVDIPDRFEAYICNATSGQDFVVWKLLPKPTLTIKKTSANTESLSSEAYSFEGVEYGVYKSDRQTLVASIPISANGASSTVTLPDSGTYYVKELTANEYYALDSAWHEVKAGAGENVTFTAIDEPKTGSLNFSKAFSSGSDPGASKEGFIFTLTSTTSGKSYSTTSNSNGAVSFTDIPFGTYTLTEKIPDDMAMIGYSAVTKPLSVNIGPSTNSINEENQWVNHKNPREEKVIVQKAIPQEERPNLEGFTFLVTGPNGFEQRITTDSKGRAETEEIVDDGTGAIYGQYTVTEELTTEQKMLYKAPPSQKQVMERPEEGEEVKALVFTFENQVKKAPVEIIKISEDGAVEGIQFTLKGKTVAGDTIREQRAVTDKNGRCKFENPLAAGNYVIEETGFNADKYARPTGDGYVTNATETAWDGDEGEYTNPAKEIVITQEQASAGETVSVAFRNVPYGMSLKKKAILPDGEASTDPVEGAVYSLYKAGESEEELISTHTTDANGEFSAYLEKGSYRLVETIQPAGYELSDEEFIFTIDEDNPTFTANATNQQKYGKLIIHKRRTDEVTGIPGTEFTLYTNPECTDIAVNSFGEQCKGYTDEYGTIIFDSLYWNDEGSKYYLKETKAVRGFFPIEEAMEFAVNGDGVEDEIMIINEEMPGAVILEKMGEQNQYLDGATFSLYKTDGTLVAEDLVTGDDNDGDGIGDGTGCIKQAGLPWGGYYFKETSAPAGYRVNPEKIRFSINSTTGGKTQYIVAIDEPQRTQVVATKKILASDLHFDHGTPTFIFHLTGTVGEGETAEAKSYYEYVTFTEEYVKNHTDTDGFVQASTTFDNLPGGDYELSEVEVLRYSQGNISNVQNGTVQGRNVIFEGIGDNAIGMATFYNEKTDWSDYSDSSALTNIVREKRLFTAVVATYTGPDKIEGNTAFDRSWLTVDAVYDDGSTRALRDDEYDLLIGEPPEPLVSVPPIKGDYTAMVKRTEDGVTRYDSFDFSTTQAQAITLHFVTDIQAGDEGNDQVIQNPTTLADKTGLYKHDTLLKVPQAQRTPHFFVSNTEVDEYEFVRWHTTSDVTSEENVLAESEPILEDMTLYAEWEHRHLCDYSWQEINSVTANASQQAVEGAFGECLDAVKNDLSTNGQISDFKHTKAYSAGGRTYHAAVAGINVDNVEGQEASVTFMTYEPFFPAGPMNQTNLSEGGWAGSAMRANLNGTVLNQLKASGGPGNFAKAVNKTSAAGVGSSSEIVTTQDTIWLPSQVELLGVWGFTSGGLPWPEASLYQNEYGPLHSLEGEGAQYPVFVTPDGIANAERAIGRGYKYWTRSLNVESGRTFVIVDAAGAAGAE